MMTMVRRLATMVTSISDSIPSMNRVSLSSRKCTIMCQSSVRNLAA